HSEQGTKDYLAYDQTKAKKLLRESTYNGDTLTIIYANDTGEYGNIAEIVKQQLEAVGFSIELIPYEWATFLDKWEDPNNWDLEIVGWSTRFSPNQLGMLIMDTSSSGWYNSENWGNLLKDWGTADTDEERKRILIDMNQTVYDDLPFYKLVNISTLDAKTDNIQGYDSWLGQRFWNTWMTE